MKIYMFRTVPLSIIRVYSLHTQHWCVRELKNAHNSVTVQNRTHVYMNFFHHKDLGNHLLQLCPKVVKHPVYRSAYKAQHNLFLSHFNQTLIFSTDFRKIIKFHENPSCESRVVLCGRTDGHDEAISLFWQFC